MEPVHHEMKLGRSEQQVGSPPKKQKKEQPKEVEGAEPEKPKPETAPKKPKNNSVYKKAKKEALIDQEVKVDDEGEDQEQSTLLPLPSTEVPANHTETPQVYLLIKEVDLNPHVSQMETEVPVAIHIITADTTMEAQTTDTQTTGNQTMGNQTMGNQTTGNQTTGNQTTNIQSTSTQSMSTQNTSTQNTSTQNTSTQSTSTQTTGTTVSSIEPGEIETIIDIDDKVISIHEKPDKAEKDEKNEKKTNQEPEFKEAYFDQLIDHFRFNNHQKTYRQRYLITDQFWHKGIGPIFLYTGNEGDVWDFANSSKFITELATEQQALVIFAEHRYYGRSLPFGKKSYERANIEFLTVEQAVADFVVLVTKLKVDLDAENCPVIAFGGSYGGMLSAYIRIKYPNIVQGALASSAPVVSAANIGDNRQFFHDVTKDFERNSPDCVSKIRQAFQELEKYAQQQAWTKMANKLSLCKPLKSKKELDQLYRWARNAFTYLAMFNYPYKTELGLHFPANPVDVACHYILKKNDYVEGLLSILGIFYNSTGSKKCFDIYSEFQHCADPTGCGLGTASQAWDFQVCTEINLLYETNNETDMFPVLRFTEDMRRNYCHNKWGVYPNPQWLKIQYWGDDFKAASNIIFSNGELDPWANGGILRNVTPTVVAYIIEGGAHHLDLRGSNPADPQSVTTIRKRESSIIKEWVKNYKRPSV
ncbi:dipeptidyl peptidase 2 [Amblyraja radiata]|uniref:dipeptidyl peptidase 2 n=1 Tax=Amblyraja radiata TaxID=386614 RepID=UPI001402ABAC|nr:dipeptidyl peptidase 2 [Amblyraja radiata]